MRTLFVEKGSGRADLRDSNSVLLPEGWARVAVSATTLHECRWSQNEWSAPGGEVVGRIVEGAGGSSGRRQGRQVVTTVRHGAGSDEVVAPVASLHVVPDDLDAHTAVLAVGCGIRASLMVEYATSLGANSTVVFCPTKPAGFLLAGLARAAGMHVIAAAGAGAPHEELLRAGYGAVVPAELDEQDWRSLANTLPGPVVVVDLGPPITPRLPVALGPVAVLRLAPINLPRDEPVASDVPMIVVDQAAVARTDFSALHAHFSRAAVAISQGAATTPTTVVSLADAAHMFPDILVRHPPGAVIVEPN